jgi:hypothetical protein
MEGDHNETQGGVLLADNQKDHNRRICHDYNAIGGKTEPNYFIENLYDIVCTIIYTISTSSDTHLAMHKEKEVQICRRIIIAQNQKHFDCV